MKKFTTFALISLAAATLLIVAGCKDDHDHDHDHGAAPAATASSGPSASLPPGLVVTDAPGGAQDVTAARKTVKDGDAVVIRGKIGGSTEPMARNRAIMTVLDPSVTTCDTMPGETCKTPWDACCEPTEKIAANSATVQVVDAAGKPLAGTLENVAGLKPLSKVTVAGTARRPAGSDTLIIEANKIHVTP
jgi:hypothetical protein